MSGAIGLAVFAMAAVDVGGHGPLLLAPFGASLMLVLSAPDLPASSNRAVVLGNLLAALCGQIAGMIFVGTPALALGAAAAFLAMAAARAQHAPALALCILMAASRHDWIFLLYPVLPGVLVIALIGEGARRLRPPVLTPAPQTRS